MSIQKKETAAEKKRRKELLKANKNAPRKRSTPAKLKKKK